MIYESIGDEKLTVAGTAVGFAAIPTTGVLYYALVSVETAPVRINAFATPTAGGAEGSILKYPGESFKVWGSKDIDSFKAIRQTTTSGVLQILYFGTK